MSLKRKVTLFRFVPLLAVIILALLIIPGLQASAGSQVFVEMPTVETLNKTYDGEAVDLLPQNISLPGADIAPEDVELSVSQYALYDSRLEGDSSELFRGVIGTVDAEGFLAAAGELPDIRQPGLYYAVYSIAGLTETYDVQFTISLPAPEDVFLSMPTGDELSREYDGAGIDFSRFSYEISPEATLWNKDVTSEAAGLVLLDIYYWDAEADDYVPADSLTPGYMTAGGYLPEEQAYADIGSPGDYRAVWSVPVFGTNTSSGYIYHYIEHSVDFQLAADGVLETPAFRSELLGGEPLPAPFLTVPDLDKVYDGNPVDFGTGLTADYESIPSAASQPNPKSPLNLL